MIVDEGGQDKYEKVIQSIKMLSVYLNFENNKIKLMARNKCYDNFEYINIVYLQ